ncbi:hypothetical protein DdX_10040 [Ditylenchus destructor]|uniref:Uncharacterized protein n=1 Tax=Ditylenchus destructor TaxID=166010 RepID=A0AAD4N1M4_9BILA|nr:hypothetical protein DdX_10040 [Ditylenchus destructor]
MSEELHLRVRNKATLAHVFVTCIKTKNEHVSFDFTRLGKRQMTTTKVADDLQNRLSQFSKGESLVDRLIAVGQKLEEDVNEIIADVDKLKQKIADDPKSRNSKSLVVLLYEHYLKTMKSHNEKLGNVLQNLEEVKSHQNLDEEKILPLKRAKLSFDLDNLSQTI